MVINFSAKLKILFKSTDKPLDKSEADTPDAPSLLGQKKFQAILKEILFNARAHVRSEKFSYLKHVCASDPGCSLGAAVIDLCEKLHRPRCAATPLEVACTLFNNAALNQAFSQCVQSPIMGNQV